MPPRQRFPRLNSRFDIKHVRDDLRQGGLLDPAVFALAAKLHRIIVTFNGDDFRKLVPTSKQTGLISLSSRLRYDQIDTRLTSLLTKSSEKALYGIFTSVTGAAELS